MEDFGYSEKELAEILGDDDFTEIYCYCCTPAHDKMVVCRGESCEMEWFHVECVGLDYDSLPDPWFCDDCTESNNSGKRKKGKKEKNTTSTCSKAKSPPDDAATCSKAKSPPDDAATCSKAKSPPDDAATCSKAKSPPDDAATCSKAKSLPDDASTGTTASKTIQKTTSPNQTESSAPAIKAKIKRKSIQPVKKQITKEDAMKDSMSIINDAIFKSKSNPIVLMNTELQQGLAKVASVLQDGSSSSSRFAENLVDKFWPIVSGITEKPTTDALDKMCTKFHQLSLQPEL
ncbi:unnamed protein product [Mytilus coruscus]|uniref:PHD-type domain-containing protein n=1 Tax=Mytilus coruscus TaxID=42192 RepID=A0A6J8B320_MYTCO|nr:unnamed protein product [Mytilus coruscus]